MASRTGTCSSRCKRKHGRPRKGNQHLKPLLVEAALSAVQADTRLKARYHRLVLRFGGYRSPAAKKKAVVAIAHTLMVIIWHLLATGQPYADLGLDFYAPRRPREGNSAADRPAPSPQPHGDPHARRLTPISPEPGSLALRRVLPRPHLGPVSYPQNQPQRTSQLSHAIAWPCSSPST